MVLLLTTSVVRNKCSTALSMTTESSAGIFLQPPRSTDLNPFDFWLWGFIKPMVYRDPIPSRHIVFATGFSQISSLIMDTRYVFIARN
ncbi:hypothetical protein TNCV_4473991 [Trichonephila clavipes]|nr:hypothetical protein TNCV_4473991 [Trichonephila clavipes]